jgi:cell fate regulator YaaT (PSP1 superfamily)
MSIFPLPQFEADLEEYRQQKQAEAEKNRPQTMVVRFGRMRLIGEYPWEGDLKPGCGSKMVVRTHRGVELAEMLTSTCPNAGCGKSVTRKQMLEYIEASGGKDYPFHPDGKVLRLATPEDMARQQELDATIPDLVRSTRQLAKEFGLAMKVVDADPILGGERLTFYFTADDRVDFRELVARLAEIHKTRVELRQVGARDEARLTADYERCGQHCCCKQFLKVLKPVSIKSAKQQKATLDPLKISGRCGRLMCCLRYEDQTYKELRQRLPRRKSRVGTPDGPGLVLSTQTLTQIVLVELEGSGDRAAWPVEELIDVADAEARLLQREKAREEARKQSTREPKRGASGKRRRKPRSSGQKASGAAPERGAGQPEAGAEGNGGKKKRRRRGRRRRRRGDGPSSDGNAGA